MPGIVGFISKISASTDQHRLDLMLDAMVREPFHNCGSLRQPEFGLAVGWVCHRNTFSDCLPVWNEQRDVGLIFVGEHYASAADRERLGKPNGDESPDDARWLVKLYEDQGMKFFEKLNGIFSGVLIDRRQSKVVLFNDRFGLGRIYWHETGDGLHFASEAKSLLKVMPHLRRLDETSLGEFFSCGCALQNRTIFSGVSLLPGASAWVFGPGMAVQKDTYFHRETWEQQPQISAEQYYEKLDDAFTRVLPRYLRGKQKIGLSLTGGLDSRMILACADILPQEMPCYTFGGPYRDCADVRLARQLAQACGQPHQVIPVTNEFFAGFPALAQRTVYGTDGGMDVTGAVEMFVNRVARDIAPVRMTGNYGSEILRSNVAFKPMPVCIDMFSPSFAPCVKAASDTHVKERVGHPTSFIAFKQVPWHHHARLAVEQAQLLPRSPYLDNELVALAYQAPHGLSLNKSLAHRFIESHQPKFAGIPTDRGVVGGRRAQAGRLGVMRQEFLPKAEYAMDYGMPQWLAKIDRVMSSVRWERLFLGRQKFYHFRVWYRDELSTYVKEMLLDPRTLNRPYLNPKRVEKMVAAHTGGYGNYTLEIHKLLTSELIQRHLIESV